MISKTASILFLFLVILCGWAPFLATAMNLPYIERPFLAVSLAIAFFSLGLIHDTAERFLGMGRGLYAAAIFCSLPAIGMLAAEPGSLTRFAPTLVIAMSVWLGANSRRDERPFFLGMIGVLSVVAGFWFGFRAEMIPLLFAIRLASRQGPRAGIVVPVLVVLFAAGALCRSAISWDLPGIAAPLAKSDFPSFATAWVWLPWVVWIFPPFRRALRRFSASTHWQLDAFLAIVLTLVSTAIFEENWVYSAAAAAPVLSLLLGEYFFRKDSVRELFLRIEWTPLFVTLCALLLFPILSSLNIAGFPPVNPWLIFASVILATALFHFRSASAHFLQPILLFSSALVIGRLLDRHTALFPDALEPVSAFPQFTIVCLASAIILLLFLQVLRSRQKQKDEKETRAEQQFGGERLFVFPDCGAPELVSLSQDLSLPFTVAFLGDSRRSESPRSSLQSYALSLSLSRELARVKPAFAIAIGDHASHATEFAYANLLEQFRGIPVPLAMTPGNHDLTYRGQYHLEYYHRIFGEDNFHFIAGNTHFIFLNNAWGSIAPEQFEWIEHVLSDSSSRMKLVFCHKPIFDPRSGKSYAMEDRAHAEQLHKLFHRFQVAAVFSGHIHSLLTEERDDVRYIISGGGGSKLAESVDRYHYLRLDIQPDAVTIRAYPFCFFRRGKEMNPLLEIRLQPHA